LWRELASAILLEGKKPEDGKEATMTLTINVQQREYVAPKMDQYRVY
jgi:hypothetical protein